MTNVSSELDRRLQMWRAIIAEGNPNDVEPRRLRDLGIYGGAQGIWVDKARTSNPAIGNDGATVAVLHTGRHYDDDLSADGVIYHYPSTERGAGRDGAEIQATKNAMSHQLPIFVVLPGKSSKTRTLRFGWVCDFDDENRQFLILFGESHPSYAPAENVDDPFSLIEEPRRRTATVLARKGQQRFRFNVLAKYGSKCSVCEIRHPQLLKAAHVCGKSEKGSDDWRNGMPLCATHHDAFDAHLFSVEPSTMKIMCRPKILPSDIGLQDTYLRPLHNLPHSDALNWRWAAAQKDWVKDSEQSGEGSLEP
jgi:hypothetical protein